ncbi:RHS repeat domain-containing protein [Aquimarina algiphila]|uniref:RHS repeat domain-containing protein n=1 Tax=Aquimarina algiphila TaxID=2047982 RepID=UPI0024930767|nr:RHS repeat-associated core domain-containing protein [Aquimarina algiphila]
MLWIFITNTAGNITYIYDATGAKLKKIAPSGSSLTETEYAGNYIYKNDNLEFFNHPEGYVEPVIASGSAAISSFDYVYQYKDHLGNIRLSYKDADGDGIITQNEIVEEKNYYPFGLQHKGYNNTVLSEHPYDYNGKENNQELGLNWHDFGARNYDAALGRWFNIDPLGEKFPSSNPYEYTFNNPISFFDPDGMENTIYIVYTNDDQEGRKEVEDMISSANALLEEYGLETRLQIFDSEDGIDRDALDDTDGIVLVGTEENVKAYDRENNLSGNWGANKEGKAGWTTSDGGYNPELTRQGEERISYVTSNEKDDRLLLFTLHGLGHQKKKQTNYDDHVYGKENYPNIMNTGVDLFAYLRKRGAKTSDVLSKDRPGNRHWQRRMTQNFGNKKAVDNYDKNDKSRVGPRRQNGRF